MPIRTDQELIRLTREGDADAVAALYDRYVPIVWRYVLARMQGDTHTGQDLLSETFLAAIRSLQNGAVMENVAGWLIGITRNKVADWYRQRARFATTEIDTDVPEKPLVNHLIADVLDEMADDERVVLEWKYIDRCSVGEIAERLGRTDKAVESLLYRARKSFRAHYDSALE